MRRARIVLAALCLALFAAPALAHVPAFAGDNATPETAHEVPDAAKSWSIYDRLDGDRVAYYEFELSAGDRLVASTFTPTGGPFTPTLVVLGPGVNGSGDVPDRVDVPEGMGARVIPGEKPASPGYEPFTPATIYRTAAVDRRVEEGGRYLLAVYEPDRRSGAVGVAVGYQERFTPVEYATVPFDLARVYLWEGTNPLVAFGPLLAVLVGGLALVGDRRESWDRPRLRYALVVSGLSMLGTAATVAVKMAIALAATGWTPAALLTVAFVLGPAIFGGGLLRLVLSERFELNRRFRLLLVVVGLGGLATWAGLVVGPLIAVLAALAPGERDEEFENGSLARE